MYACICRGVTERKVSAAIVEGACTVDDLVAGCGAGSRCGGCLPVLHRLLQECLALTGSGSGADAGLTVGS